MVDSVLGHLLTAFGVLFEFSDDIVKSACTFSLEMCFIRATSLVVRHLRL